MPINRALITLLLILIATVMTGQPAQADGEEDFSVEEEGMAFDHARTGMFYRRNVYIDGDDVTHTPYYPIGGNDTRNIRQMKFYVDKIEQDPPNQITVYVRDDSTYFYNTAFVDVRVTIAQADRLGNNIAINQAIRENVPIQKGINRIPVNIHHYKGDIVKAHLIGVRIGMSYLPIEFTAD